MQPNPHQVFPSVTAYRVVTTLKLPLEQRNGFYFTRHPKYPTREFQLQTNGFVGSSNLTPACNVFDFLALHLGSYEQAVDFVIGEFFHLAVMSPGQSFGALRDQLVKQLKTERQRFEEIWALGQPLRTHDHGLAAAMYCRRFELEPHLAVRMFYVVRGDALNRVLHYAKPSVRPLRPEELYWVFPYFKNHHTFGLLQIEDAQGKLVRTLKLNPSRTLYFGLHSELAGAKETRVFATRQEALAAYGHARKMSRFLCGFVHLIVDPKAEDAPGHERGVFVATGEADFEQLEAARHAFGTLDVAETEDIFAEELPALAWHDYALAKITAAIKQDQGCSSRVAAMVRSVRNDASVFPALLTAC